MIDTHNIVKLYRGWNVFEQNLASSYGIIDIDLCDSTDYLKYKSREQILNDLIRLRDNILHRSPEEQMLLAKLNASICFLQSLLENNMSFSSHIKNTFGLSTTLFSEEEIEYARSELINHLEKFDLKLTPEFKTKFNKLFYQKSSTEIGEQIITASNKWLEKLKEYIGNFELPCLQIKFVTLNTYWQNWISGSSEKILFRINLHDRASLIKGYTEILAMHEICGHIVLATKWNQSIKEKAIPEALGILTLHTPEQFMIEGIAQTLPYLLPSNGELSDYSILSRELEQYRYLIYHNAHIMINTGVSIDNIVNFAKKNLPFDSTDFIEAEIKDRLFNRQFRLYQFLYAPSRHFFRQIINKLSFNQKTVFLKKMYETVMTVKQIVQWIQDEFEVIIKGPYLNF